MSWLFRAILLSLLVLTAACSIEAAINKFSSPEDRAFAQRFVSDIRRGNEEGLKAQFDPELWAKSREQLPEARNLYPAGEGATRLIGYNFSTNIDGSGSRSTKEYILVTSDDKHWTRTRIVTLSQGGPAKVVEWNVNGTDQPPPDLLFYESMERILPWVQAGAVILLLAFIGLIWWLVRRSRRRAAGTA